MSKFSGLLICSDFDGTLFCNGKVSEENLEAIRYFQENGGLFTLATGRYPTILEAVKVSFKCNAPMLCMNGAIIYDSQNDKTLWEGKMLRDYTDILMEILRTQSGLRDLRICASDEWKAEYFDFDDRDGISSAMARDPYKILVHVDSEFSEELRDRAIALSGDGYSICRSWQNGVEIQESYYDKGKSSRRLADMLGADKLICVGDYENDIPMLREADLSVAVGNAIDSVKEVADIVTARADEHGIARLIESL